MSSTKLIRHGMERVAPPPEGTTQEATRDQHLIKALLVAKGNEELQEVATASTREALLGELGDVYEVLHSLATMHRFTMGQVIAAASRKAAERGCLLMHDTERDLAVGIIHRVPIP